MSNNKVCANCGKKVLGNCTNPNCQAWKEQLDRITIANCFSVIGSLAQRLTQENVAGTKEDYQEIKKVQEKINKLSKEGLTDQFIKGDIEDLKKSCQDLTNEYISPKVRKKVDKGKNTIHETCCLSKNIKLEKNDSESYYYCDYCWEIESLHFLKSLQNYHLENLQKTLSEKGVNFSQFSKNSNAYKKLLSNTFANQKELQQVYQELEEELNNGGINIPQQNNNPINDNQQKAKQQLQQSITNLENKPNKTPAEEQDLATKKKRLEELDKEDKNTNTKSDNKSDHNLLLYCGIGAIGLLIIGLVLLVIYKKKK